MRTSLNEIQKIERYLQKKLNPGESLLFEARILTNPILRLQATLQRKVYALVKLHHHKKLKDELEEIHQNLFSDPDKKEFQKTIFQLFKK